MTGTDTAPNVAFELPSELAIDTGVARRVIAEFIRGQLEQAGFERLVVGLSGGIDSAVVAFLVAEAIGAERLLAVMMPYRTSSPASRSDAESVIATLGCPSDLVDITPMVDGYFERAAGSSGGEATPIRRGNFAARMRMSVLYDRSVTFGGLVVGTGNKTELLIGYTTLRRLGVGFQPDRRPLQEPDPPARGRPRRPRRDRPEAAVGRPLARPDRRDRVASAIPFSTGCCSGGSTSGVRSRRWSLSGSRRRWSSGSTASSPARSSSARSRRSPSSVLGRAALTTSTRDAGRGRPAADDRGGKRGGQLCRPG